MAAQLSTAEDRRIYILKEEKPALAVIKLGVPLIAGMFIMVLYNLVDTFLLVFCGMIISWQLSIWPTR